MSPFLRAYFSRLSWTGEPDVSIDTLRELHLQHNSAIPFENLDVLLPREIHLDDGALEEKLIAARRGGYCFEQNGLLERALREIGFNVRSLLGRVVLANPPQMPPRTHRLLLVEVAGERWIADVGFGGQTLTAPIKLLADIPQQTPHGSYRLVHEGDEWTLQFNHHEHWQSMYHFDLGRQYASDYVMGNFWSAHWPQSHFRHHLLMCRHLPDGGKMTLTNFHFKVDFADPILPMSPVDAAKALRSIPIRKPFLRLRGPGACGPEAGQGVAATLNRAMASAVRGSGRRSRHPAAVPDGGVRYHIRKPAATRRNYRYRA